MDTTVKRQWINALRSGQYEQGRQCLRDAENKYCCLGVLADIVAPGRWTHTNDGYRHDSMNGLLSMETLAAAGWGEQEPGEDAESNLANMNDNGYSFESIAQWIEDNL